MLEIQILLVILVLINIALLARITKISASVNKLSDKISDVGLYSEDAPRPLLQNIENLRDDIFSLSENLFRVMKKYDIDVFHPPISNPKEKP